MERSKKESTVSLTEDNEHDLSKGEAHEKFLEPVIPDLAFSYNWTIWEQYEAKFGEDYRDTMAKVAWFGDAVTFWQIWNTIKHSDPKNFFSYESNGKMFATHYEVGGFAKKISSLSLFKTGIVPEWEDVANIKGGEFSLKIRSDETKTKNIWNFLVLDLISGNFPHIDHVCGIRVVDKVRTIKIELWTDYHHKNDFEGHKDQESRLIQLLQDSEFDSQKIDYF